jgi:uncharacterized coiled-coil DUF342 family protein
MSKSDELRRQAEMIRQAAEVRTTGGHSTNKLLRHVARKLESKAEKIERLEKKTAAGSRSEEKEGYASASEIRATAPGV